MNGFKPSPPARCLFCGTIGAPWWTCSCRWADEVREGKRQKPKVRRLGDGRTVIELDAETVARNPLGMPRYTREKSQSNRAADVSAEASNTGAYESNTAADQSNAGSNRAPQSNSGSNATVDQSNIVRLPETERAAAPEDRGAFDKTAYQRELMRKRRAAERTAEAEPDGVA
jgi:hypothetical protein